MGISSRFLAGASSRRASDKGSRKGLFAQKETDSCPVSYPRLTVQVRLTTSQSIFFLTVIAVNTLLLSAGCSVHCCTTCTRQMLT